jgi:hypothetical protein
MLAQLSIGQSGVLIAIQINDFLATALIPNIRKLLVDQDKVATACSNIVYYIIGPTLKGKAK